MAGGLLIGVAAAAKTNALLLLPAVAVAIWFAHARRPARTRGVWLAWLAAGVVLSVAPITVRNYVVSERVVLVNSTGGRNLWKGNGPQANGTHVRLPSDEAGTNLTAYLFGDFEVDPRRAAEESSEYTRRTLEYAADHPVRSVALLGKKGLLFFNAVELGIRDRFYFAQRYSPLLQLPLPAFGWVVPLGLVGMLWAWRLRERVALLYATVAVQVVSFVLVFILARYRLVAVACLILFASYLAFEWIEALRRRQLWPVLLSIVALALAAALVNLPLSEFPRERGFGLQHAQLGNHHMGRKEYERAIEAYERAVHGDWEERDPEASRFTCRLFTALAYRRLGRHAEAREIADTLRLELQQNPRLLSGVRERLNPLLEGSGTGQLDPATVFAPANDPEPAAR